ncbi:MAG: hypothetical protein JST59_00360 [Actinobacteria bacterium]|nr:hypothetical protein [Actinomycetota bacterium]
MVLPESSPHAEELVKPKQPEGKADIRETIVNQMVDMLINEFSEEFVKHIKQLKKKKSLPGIKISKTTINRYLDGMIDHLMEYHQKQIVHNLNKIAGVDPKTLLRFMRDDFDDADDVESQDS